MAGNYILDYLKTNFLEDKGHKIHRSRRCKNVAYNKYNCDRLQTFNLWTDVLNLIGDLTNVAPLLRNCGLTKPTI